MVDELIKSYILYFCHYAVELEDVLDMIFDDDDLDEDVVVTEDNEIEQEGTLSFNQGYP